MQTSHRFLSRLHHSQKHYAFFIFNPRFISCNNDLLPSLTQNNDNNNFTAKDHSFNFGSYTHSRGFFTSNSSNRFVLLGLVSLDGNQNHQNLRHYLSHRGELGLFCFCIFFLVFICLFLCILKCIYVCVMFSGFFTRAKQVKRIEINDRHRYF